MCESLYLRKKHDRLYKINPDIYQPTISSIGEWIVSEFDIECIALGGGILGSGGGGNRHIGKEFAFQKLREGKRMRVSSVKMYEERANMETDRVCSLLVCGAPAAVTKTTHFESKAVLAHETFEGTINTRELQPELFQQKGCKINIDDNLCPSTETKNSKKPFKVTGIRALEVGGLNSIVPLIVAAEKNIPVIDCDGVGRAFPELQMCAALYHTDCPVIAAVVPGKGRKKTVLRTDNLKDMDADIRNICTENGLAAAALCDLEPGKIAENSVLGSLSRTWNLGLCVLQARKDNSSPVSAILKHGNGKIVLTGEIIDVKIETVGGFDRGCLTIKGIREYLGKSVKIEFQNENLVVRGSSSEVLASVPDIIICVDPASGEPVTTEEAEVGHQVSVLVLPCSPQLTTPKALSLVGPKAFGYDDVIYSPVGEYINHRGVPK